MIQEKILQTVELALPAKSYNTDLDEYLKNYGFHIPNLPCQ